jgi:hypothetical protein
MKNQIHYSDDKKHKRFNYDSTFFKARQESLRYCTASFHYSSNDCRFDFVILYYIVNNKAIIFNEYYG